MVSSTFPKLNKRTIAANFKQKKRKEKKILMNFISTCCPQDTLLLATENKPRIAKFLVSRISNFQPKYPADVM